MPISLELFNFTEAFHIRHVKTIAESFQRLGKWLTNRVKQADALERATQRIPAVWFYNESVTLWIDASQKDVLAPKEPPPSFGDHLQEGGRRFVEGIKNIKKLPQESLIIPGFIDAVLNVVNEIVKSMERFQKPTKAMFDLEARTASDLFGEVALGWRALYGSKDQLLDFLAKLKILKGPEKPTTSVASVNKLPDMFERVSRYIVTGLYLVTLLPEFVQRVWQEASIFIRAKVLDEFAKIEAQVFGVRRKVIDIFYVDLRQTLRQGLTLALTWRSLSSAWVWLFLTVSEIFGMQIFEQFSNYFAKLSGFVHKIVDLFRGLEKLLEDLVTIDLQPLLQAKLREKSSFTALLPDPPSLTLGDLAAPEKRAAANMRLQKWITAVEGRVGDIAGRVGYIASGLGGGLIGGAAEAALRAYLQKYRRFLDLAFGKRTKEPKETGAFAGPLPKFPDISQDFTTWLEPLRQSLADFIPSLQTQTNALIDKGKEALDRIGGHFDRAAASALRGPAVEPYLAISGAAARLAEKALPSSDVVEGRLNAAVGAMARTWETWLVQDQQSGQAGFYVIGAVIPKYIEAMRVYWAERQASGEEATVRLPEDLPKDFPTSPHIMALRPVLARTMVPRITIAASGHELDDELSQRVAEAFLDGVQAAHRQGLAKLAGFQAAAGD